MPEYNPDTARIKMVILTKNSKANYEWHSYDKYNNSSKPDKDIIAGMLRRFMAKPYSADAQVIQFYDNKTGVLIDQYDK